ncbi:helix-turn-helix domain-containing protein [Gracilibacillus saliphilus]|uniref:helix-turn-helix domain-containing protein n=1 Tax=Gracilibacillus saliphilus TaxID=543890 RepID=UPI0013D40057|nr:helix-turn-helix domain-containing protein [Gracilibacillus saliphilus]
MHLDKKDKIWILMRQKGIKSKDIASNLNISTALVSLWLNDKANIKKEKAEAIINFVDSYPSKMG